MLNAFECKHRPIQGAAALALGLALALPLAASADAGGRTLFIPSAVEHPDDTVTLPLHSGRGPNGEEVFFVIFDSSDGKDAAKLGVNQASKLNNARGTAAVQKVALSPDGTISFSGVAKFGDFGTVATPPFLPAANVPLKGQGDAGYSPLIQLPDGTVRNAPQIATSSQSAVHPKVVGPIDFANRRVTLRETHGFSGGKAVKYVSTDASADIAAALEGATFVPALNEAPFAGGDGTDSARASLAAFVNGQTGAANPQRQGLNSAILDGLDPLNVLAWNPSQGRYSPLWDVHLAAWSAGVVAVGQNLRQTDFGTVTGLADHGLLGAPGGARFGPAGFIVVCPIVSSD